MAESLENEKTILLQTHDQARALGDQLGGESSDGTKDIQRKFDRTMEIYWRQLSEFKEAFPGVPEGSFHEASFYCLQAHSKFHSVGLIRKASQSVAKGANKVARTGSGFGLVGVGLGAIGGLVGGSLALGTAMIANQQEKANAREAINLLDKAIQIIDIGFPHMRKAVIYHALGQRDEAVAELDYIISHLPNDDTYVDARQLKDEILTPKKKKWFGF